jgi:hypothetical protein
MNQHLIRSLLIVVLLLVWLGPARAQEPTPDARFGLVQTYDDFESAEILGPGFSRIKLYWDIIQPEGPDDWQPSNVPDPLVDADLAAGREVVGLIVRTPAWARDPDHPGNEATHPGLKDVPDMDAWGRFVRRLVEQYDGRISRWIIWNEPDVWNPDHPGSTWNGSEEDYFELLKTAYFNIKAVDPSMKVYLAGFTYWWDKEYDRQQYLSRLLEIIANDPAAAENGFYFDGVIYHLYYKPQQVYDILTEVRATLDENGLTEKTIWLNETNAPPSSDPLEPPHREPRFKASLAEQSTFMIQVHAMAFAAGAERVQVYKLLNSTEHPEDVQPFGLIRGDNSRRPAFDSYRVATTYLSGFEDVNLFQQGDVNVVVFDRPDDTVTVLWNVAPTARYVTVNAITDRAILVDEAGRTQPISAVRGRYTLELPPATCSDGDCFIGGPSRLIVERGSPEQRQPHAVQPTVTPTPTPRPSPIQVLAVSPRRQMVFVGVSIFGFVVSLVALWWFRSRWLA